MVEPYKPYVPENVSDVMDQLAFMMLYAPRFEDDSGYFPGQNVDTTFFALNGGLSNIRKKVGEETYQALTTLSDRMRAHFEADPDDVGAGGTEGRVCIHEMEDILIASARRKSR
jgi:hypothetical protein